MNRPSQRRANPDHPHTFKRNQRLLRRHERYMERWHARWEAEQYGGGLDESPSAAVLERLAQTAFEIMPHRHPSGRTPDWSLQPACVRDVFAARAYSGRFDGLGVSGMLAGHLSQLQTLSRVRSDSIGYDSVPTEAAVLAAVDAVTGDLARADLDISVCSPGGISILDVDTFVFWRIDADGSRHRT